MNAAVLELAISELQCGLADASVVMRKASSRIHELESCLNRMVLLVQNTISDSEGNWPSADAGCIDCTSGTVPDRLNTGPMCVPCS